jgi:hypothetical protein
LNRKVENLFDEMIGTISEVEKILRDKTDETKIIDCEEYYPLIFDQNNLIVLLLLEIKKKTSSSSFI